MYLSNKLNCQDEQNERILNRLKKMGTKFTEFKEKQQEFNRSIRERFEIISAKANSQEDRIKALEQPGNIQVIFVNV